MKAKAKDERWMLCGGDYLSIRIVAGAVLAYLTGDPDSVATVALGNLLTAAPRLRDLLAEMVRAERNGVPPPLKAATELLNGLGVDVERKG